MLGRSGFRRDPSRIEGRGPRLKPLLQEDRRWVGAASAATHRASEEVFE
jgi:hypothetical protein